MVLAAPQNTLVLSTRSPQILPTGRIQAVAPQGVQVHLGERTTLSSETSAEESGVDQNPLRPVVANLRRACPGQLFATTEDPKRFAITATILEPKHRHRRHQTRFRVNRNDASTTWLVENMGILNLLSLECLPNAYGDMLEMGGYSSEERSGSEV
ncbi:hypothetical protein H920_14838 [Fukomys damarensis]|uniref:Uncharacterized protein n=1 Tax=Fukomys damarensis TaxID=885580 RepID=A0A091CVH4_FUKDA|nr:hypothetical protein H920_14838 [Fukomys damarensis]